MPYKIHIVLTDNGTHFTEPTGDGWTPEDIKAMRADGMLFRCHSFEMACADLDIEHRLTKPRHPWTNGQVERMNRTIKDATVKRFYYETHDELEKASGGLRRRLQLRPSAQDAARPHTIRSHLQSLGRKSVIVHRQSAPPIAGTKHLGQRR